jgi:diaminobutyrate-2-oxoglutarate transaminase
MTNDTHATTVTTIESEVRSYCRLWPVVFDRADGARLFDEQGRSYLDFFAGAGALNYGHNHPRMRAALVDYLTSGGVIHSLDMTTVAKRNFLDRFREAILEPRGLDYRVQFPGPTGTNAVEAALKLARKITGRETIVSFTNAFHGMTLGSLAVTGNSMKRNGAGVPLHHSVAMPYCDFLEEGSTLDYLESMVDDAGSGLDHPAAVIVETTQGEGGLRSASSTWLQRLERICRAHEMLFIIDDVQMGCGRTGPFFSFESSGVDPDFVCLSKSLSGFGLPMAMTLIRPELDAWAPGEHNGTFRGHNPAFVTGAVACDLWAEQDIAAGVRRRAETVEGCLVAIAAEHAGVDLRGRGLAQGLVFDEPGVAGEVAVAAFRRGLLIETSGPRGEVAKLMPPILIGDDDLEEGLARFVDAVGEVTGRTRTVQGVAR